jgi:CRISPR-associated protein Cas2
VHYLIAYDIADDRRRHRIAKLLKGYGTRSQYSLFECHLTPHQLRRLRHRLDRRLDHDTDRLAIYPIAANLASRIQRLGQQTEIPPPARSTVI